MKGCMTSFKGLILRHTSNTHETYKMHIHGSKQAKLKGRKRWIK